MTLNVVGQEKLDIGKVFQATFQVIKQRFAVLAGLSALLTVVPSLGMLLLATPLFQGFSERPTNPFPPSFLPLFGLASPVLMLVTALSQASMTHVAISELSGAPTTFREALIIGVRRMLPVLGVVILSVLAAAMGFVFLIVPGVMIALAFCVVVPTITAERTTIFGAFDRSRALTRNNRWRIFGLVLIFMIASWVFEMVIAGLTGGFMPVALTSSSFLSRLAISVFEGFFTTIVSTIGLAALYAELRRIKDGVGASDLAAVFD